LWLLARGAPRRTGRAWWGAAAALSFLLSVGSWFPYALAGGSVVLSLLLWGGPDAAGWGSQARQRLQMLAVFLVVLALAGLLMLSLGQEPLASRAPTNSGNGSWNPVMPGPNG